MSRVQLALNVNDIDEAVAFYTKLFGAEPAKRRPGYANFAISEPPLKLVLLENPGQGGSLNHLGVEVADTDTVDAEQARLAAAGLASVDEHGTTCCYAKQDKFWGREHGPAESEYPGDPHAEAARDAYSKNRDGPACAAEPLDAGRRVTVSAGPCGGRPAGAVHAAAATLSLEDVIS